MSGEQVVVNISPAGLVSVDAQGFTGTSCDKATEFVELTLGGSGSRKRENKPEYHLPESGVVHGKMTF